MGGIIQAALLGGAEGLGAGVAVAGKNWTSELLEAEKQKAIGMREENLARLNNQAAADRQQTDIGAREHLERDVRQPFEAGEHDKDRAQRVMEFELQRASHEKIARLGRETQEAIAKMHGTVQVGEGGKLLWVGAGGETKDTGFTAQKDLPPSAKVAADVLRDQLKAIDKAESDAMNQTPEQQRKYGDQRLRLNGQLLAVLSGDLNKAFSTDQAKVEPPAGAIAALKKDPKLAPDFKAKYGVDPQQYLSSSSDSPQMPRGLIEEPPGSQPVKPPAGPIGRLVDRAEEERKRRERARHDRLAQPEYNDSGY